MASEHISPSVMLFVLSIHRHHRDTMPPSHTKKFCCHCMIRRNDVRVSLTSNKQKLDVRVSPTSNLQKARRSSVSDHEPVRPHEESKFPFSKNYRIQGRRRSYFMCLFEVRDTRTSGLNKRQSNKLNLFFHVSISLSAKSPKDSVFYQFIIIHRVREKYNLVKLYP